MEGTGPCATRQAEQAIVADCPWAILENRVNFICLQPYVRGVKEQLANLDVGQSLD